jgi:class 3 adenylate cyclase/tetratricopeptide (TPR) repeat protein
MQCQACNTVNADANRFCENCGGRLMQRCGECGYEIGAAARFCGGCGATLNRPAAPVVAKSPAASWGELKLATILFADIVSSTEHIAGLDPEQAMDHLRPAVGQMCQSIESFGGTVVRTLGDGVMAVFGVPRALEGHASLACEAALAMQETFKDHPQGLTIRVGLHAGQVASDPQAADAAIGGGVHGRAIHLASRVVGLAEPGGICLTSACLALVRPACEVRAMGVHSLKGIAEPVEIHALLGMRSEFADIHFHRGATSSFRGRKRELVTLQDALRRAETGLGAAIGIAGAPGSGKSRLSHEFAQWCRDQGVPVHEVRTQLYGHSMPLQPVLALLRSCFFGITAADDPATARKRVAIRLAELGPVAADDLALLNEFLGVAEPGVEPSLPPKARRARLLGLVADLAKHNGTNTSVILFEDLHWLDEASEEFLSVLVDTVARARTLLLLNYRPAYRAPWTKLPHFQQMNLAQLSAEDTEELVRELLGSRPGMEDALALIVERAAGNPFFAEELVHSLAESGMLSALPGGQAPSAESIAQALPPTVQAVIAERIDRLGGTQKTLLHICAVIGKEIPLGVLRQVAVYVASQIETGLEGLCEADLLQLLREIAGGRRFAFRHPLIQEVAYGTQLKTRRAELHAAVAIAMEQHYRDQPDEFAALIAHHYEAAGQPTNAAVHEARAAQWLGATNSTQAMRHWRKARALLMDQPRSPDIDRLRVRIGSGFVYLGWREGLSPQEVQLIVRETVDLASEIDGRLIQLLLLAEGRLLQGNGGAADDYVQNLQKALVLAGERTDTGRSATMHAALSHAYSWAGLLEAALAANDVALQGMGSIDKLDREFFGFDIKQWVLGIRVRVLVRMSRFREASQCLQVLADSVEATHDPVIRQMVHHLHTELAWSAADVDTARGHAAKVSRIARESGSAYSRVFDLWTCAIAEVAAQDFAEAAHSCAKAIELIRSARVAVESEAEILAILAECRYRAGDLELALADATAALDVARERSNRFAQARAMIVYGAVLARDPGRPVEAQAAFEQAGTLISQSGASVLAPLLAREQQWLAAT